MNTITTPIRRSLRSLVLLGGLTAAAVAVVPGAVGAGCTGQTIHATANNQVLKGTGCDDFISIGRWANVTVYAGGGNDTIKAGFNGGISYIYGEAGNDTVINMGFKQVWVDGGSGNDTLEGSDKADTFHGGTGTGTDRAEIGPGDYASSIEVDLLP